jgi:multidrug efflux pump subunit AcrA (membrane-fusion protein)
VPARCQTPNGCTIVWRCDEGRLIHISLGGPRRPVGVALRAWWKSKRILLTLCLLALAFGVLASYAARSSYFASNREQPGAKGAKQPVAVAALGRIEPHSEIINVGAGVSPDRLESLFVARGDLVKKDQVLGYLGGYAEQIAQRDMYRAQLEEARLRLRTEIELNRSRIEAAEIHQRQILEVSPLRIAAQEATIESLEAKLANDKDILDSHAQLFSRLRHLGIDIHIWTMPGEIENAIPFDQDRTHAQYDPVYAQKFWLACRPAVS